MIDSVYSLVNKQSYWIVNGELGEFSSPIILWERLPYSAFSYYLEYGFHVSSWNYWHRTDYFCGKHHLYLKEACGHFAVPRIQETESHNSIAGNRDVHCMKYLCQKTAQAVTAALLVNFISLSVPSITKTKVFSLSTWFIGLTTVSCHQHLQTILIVF